MNDELIRLLEELVDERVSYKMKEYDKYMHSGSRSSMSFDQYMRREQELDRQWRLSTGQYTDN